MSDPMRRLSQVVCLFLRLHVNFCDLELLKVDDFIGIVRKKRNTYVVIEWEDQ